jgi:hypothetical protein
MASVINYKLEKSTGRSRCQQPLETYVLIACWIGECEPSLVFPEMELMGFLKPYEPDRIVSNSFKFAMKKRGPFS